MRTRRFHSNATSPGIGIGKAFRVSPRISEFVRTWIRNNDIKREIRRFNEAVYISRQQLENVQSKLCRYQGDDQIKIIESHRLLVQDESFLETTRRHIIDYKINAEWALDKTLGQLKLSFLGSDSEYIRERQQDIDYIGRRIMDNLLGTQRLIVTELPAEDIVMIATDLSPAEIAGLPRDRVKGFIMEVGGGTSHSAIIARALEIPALFGVTDVYSQVSADEIMIVDGIKGLAIASPKAQELKFYDSIRTRYEAIEKDLLREIHLPAQTKDGYKLMLEGNIELVEEIPSILHHGAEGIGLYRTEYLFLDRLDTPSEDEQYDNYLHVLKQMSPRKVTIRTIDLGSDKMPRAHQFQYTANPALGVRAIRYCLNDIPTFKTQLRALWRASTEGNLRVLLPMITDIMELRQVKKIIQGVERELQEQKIPFAKSIPLGIMVEVPAAVWAADLLARECDFFSIGTNDLIQYGLAIDRVNEHVSYLYQPYHPSVIRMIQQTVIAAKKNNIPVSLCGELAGDPLAITLLVAMNLDSLSMNAISIPRVKRTLRSLTHAQSLEILDGVLALDHAGEIENYLKQKTKHLLPKDVLPIS